MGSAIENFALFGKDEATGVTMEQRDIQILLERADLPAHRRLREAEIVARMGEGACANADLRA